MTPNHNNLLQRDLPYEIHMLRSTWALLQLGVFSGDLKDALIESFGLHARNLTEFFRDRTKPRDRKKKRDDDIDASAFTDESYAPFDGNPEPEELVDKLHKQIAHLTLSRFSGAPDQLHRDDFETLRRFLEPEIERFEKHLRQECVLIWNQRRDAPP